VTVGPPGARSVRRHAGCAHGRRRCAGRSSCRCGQGYAGATGSSRGGTSPGTQWATGSRAVAASSIANQSITTKPVCNFHSRFTRSRAAPLRPYQQGTTCTPLTSQLLCREILRHARWRAAPSRDFFGNGAACHELIAPRHSASLHFAKLNTGLPVVGEQVEGGVPR